MKTPCPTLLRRRHFLSTVAIASTADLGAPAVLDAASAPRKGRLKQGLCRGVFKGEKLDLDGQCREAARLGAVGIDLVGPDAFPMLKQHGLIPTMAPGGDANLRGVTYRTRLTQPHPMRALLTSLFAGLTLVVFVVPQSHGAVQPNVLLIVSDDLRDTVGCYGNQAVKTPNLDRLAARGVLFQRAYAQYPVCNPSRTSFMTGLRCEQTGVVGNTTMFRSRLPDIITMPQLLRQHGWYAASYGKIYHVGEAAGAVRDGWMDLGKSWDEARMFQPTPAGRKGEVRNLTGGKLKWCEVGAMEGADDDQPDGQNAAHAIAAIEQQTAAGKPWFVGAGFHRPHDPFLVPKKYFDLYSPGSLKLYHDPVDISSAPPLAMPGGGTKSAFDAFTDQDRLDFLRGYYAGVSFTDAQVGRLLDVLDRLKLWENTVVIFAGDNGYHHNERNWWNKNTLFERSCRVPLIVAAPGSKAGRVCRGLVELVDLYPTVADFCGVKAPHKLAGQSLRPLLEEPARPGKDAAFTLVTRGPNKYGQTVRTDRWRYTRWCDGTAELYDEFNDPEETRNLVNDPRHSAALPDLQKLLDEVGPFRPVAAGTGQPVRGSR